PRQDRYADARRDRPAPCDRARRYAGARGRAARLCSELELEHGGVPLGSALDLAIWRALEPGVAAAEPTASPRLATLPFTFERQRASVVVETAGHRRLLCKGAAEEVLARCSFAAGRAEVDATLRGRAAREGRRPRRRSRQAVAGRARGARRA